MGKIIESRALLRAVLDGKNAWENPNIDWWFLSQKFVHKKKCVPRLPEFPSLLLARLPSLKIEKISVSHLNCISLKRSHQKTLSGIIVGHDEKKRLSAILHLLRTHRTECTCPALPVAGWRSKKIVIMRVIKIKTNYAPPVDPHVQFFKYYAVYWFIDYCIQNLTNSHHLYRHHKHMGAAMTELMLLS
jgi:hypothetical protein